MSRDDAAIGVSGRINPGPVRHPLDGDHDIRVWGGLGPAHGPVMVGCEPCEWHTYIEGGHKLEDLDRLAVMHEGREAP
jgi:hypothetical protein